MTLRICHLYGNLMNTYGDNGNLLMLKYIAKQLGEIAEIKLVSLKDKFDPKEFDIVLFGGGQDYEQQLIARDLPNKKIAIQDYIENDGLFIAICGGYQLLGHYYENANGEEIPGLGILDLYTKNDQKSRLISDVEIYNKRYNMTLVGYENHGGRTHIGPSLEALGIVKMGYGNNGQDHKEGCQYKQTYGTYLHGPFLVRNPKFTESLIKTCLQKKDQLS